MVKIREKLEFLFFRGSKNGPKSNPLGTQEMATFFRVALMLSWGLVVTIQSAAFKLESGLGFDNGPSPAHTRRMGDQNYLEIKGTERNPDIPSDPRKSIPLL